MKTKIFFFLMFTLITLTGCNKKSAEGAESAGVDFLQTDGVVPEIRFYGEWSSASGFSEIITQVQQVLVDDYGPGILLTTATGGGIYLLEQGYSGGGISFDELQLKILSWNRDILNDAEERAQIK